MLTRGPMLSDVIISLPMISILLALFGSVAARKVSLKVASVVLPKVVGTGWDAILAKRPKAAFDKVFREWREQIAADISSGTIAIAFEEFFCRNTTIAELRKLFSDEYEAVDFDLLTAELKSACEWANCPCPRRM